MHDADGRDAGRPDTEIRVDAFGEWFEEDQPRSRPPVQWRVARSAALVFLGVALAVGAALFLVRSSEPSAAAVSVQLDTEVPGPASPDGSQESQESRGDGSPGPGEGPGDLPGATAPGAAVGRAIDGTGGATAPSGAVAPTGSGGTGQLSVFYVTGAVASPGVVTAPPGTRLFELIEQVGGPTPDADLEGINLAATPADGAHIHLLAVGEEPRAGSTTAPEGAGTASGNPVGDPAGASVGAPAGATGASAGEPPVVTGGTAGLVDLNAATLAELQTLPRIGPVLGQRILDWRAQNGPFTQPADLDAVPGIGPAMLEGILPLVVVR